MGEQKELPWNWCPQCKTHVDDDMLTGEFLDGSTGTCVGCRTVYVAVAFEDDTWQLVPAKELEDDESDDDSEDSIATAIQVGDSAEVM